MHVLDNAAWHALTGPHATLAERVRNAARYEPEVSVFGALCDDATPDAWDDLRDLVGPGGVTAIARTTLSLPDGWTVVFQRPCRQMWLPDSVPVPDPPNGTGTRVVDPADLVVLGPEDVPEMLALVERARPGPFVERTIELGTYLGVRSGGDLVAMAGERLHPPGFTEISAVCTDLEHRGRGLASRLVVAIVGGIRARREIPCLHLTTDNLPAQRIYSALGFETRAHLDVVGVRAPR